MEAGKYEETHTRAPKTTAQDPTDGFSSCIRKFGWCNDLLLELEEILRRISEMELKMEFNNTKVNDMIGEALTLYMCWLLYGTLFPSNGYSLSKAAPIHFLLSVIDTRLDK